MAETTKVRHTARVHILHRVYPTEEIEAEFARCCCGWTGPHRSPGSGAAERDCDEHEAEHWSDR